ncbi:MAG: hypothetical protein K6B72_03580 [Lachnospiraceae bacterium]|nr:hypothetical protein [Lachnospiraceae bacterium]
MKKAQIVIVDEDPDFCRQLDGCLRYRLGFPVTVHDFTESSVLSEYTERRETAVLLITETAAAGAELKGFPGVIILTEGRETAAAIPEQVTGDLSEKQVIRRVQKYRPMDALIREVRALCLDFGVIPGEAGAPDSKKALRIGFFSPLGRCLQSTAALTLARLYAEQRKTLYLTFDPFPGIDWDGYAGEETGDLAELFYYFDCDPGKFALHAEKCTLRCGPLYVVPSAALYESISEPEPEKWRAFLEMLITQTDYEVIVSDLSICIRGLFDLFREFDRIVTIVRTDPASAEELRRYDRMLKRTGHEDIKDRTTELELPVFRRLPADPSLCHRGELADHMRRFMTRIGGEEEHADT